MSKLKPWKLINSKLIFDHQWYKLRRDHVKLPDGKELDDYFVSVREDVVLIFPITKNHEVIFVRQYKHGAQEILLELPGGFFNSKEESAEEAALRELNEETGYSTENITLLKQAHDNPTKDTNSINLFIAKDVEQTSAQHLDETEEIELVFIPINEVKEMLISGELKVSGSLALCSLALIHLGVLR